MEQKRLWRALPTTTTTTSAPTPVTTVSAPGRFAGHSGDSDQHGRSVGPAGGSVQDPRHPGFVAEHPDEHADNHAPSLPVNSSMIATPNIRCRRCR